ncbi:MAG: ribonuclease E/G, partial [Sandarakinorhabdus sp.]|nr:ribonuclease E/G [Sandarakinorhabdus sp.]
MRAIRVIYHRDIDQVLVEGPEGFADAQRFMSMLMPGHTPKVVEYADNVPLFQRFGVEQQLEGMYQPVVQLKSGGYIVINPTEALVSIDINSGRSTREYGIEDTATKTNLEAADEIGRQLRLRDMAGLVVIDFIDMEVSANNRRVEKAMKDALRNDRARIQIGRISSFGLMEMSRQRLRTGILEASTHICPMCDGTGMVRSVSSAALAALRALEAEALRGRASEFTLRAGDEVAVYILNKKRIELAELEELYGVTIVTVPDESLIGPNFAIDERGPAPSKKVEMRALPVPVRIEDDPDDFINDANEDEDSDERSAGERDGDRAERGSERNGERGGRNKRRRRGGRTSRDEAAGDAPTGALEPADGDDSEVVAQPGETADEADARGGRDGGDRKRRRRGRRGKRDGAAAPTEAGPVDTGAGETGAFETGDAVVAPLAEAPGTDGDTTKPKRNRRRKADVEGVPDMVVKAAAVVEPVTAPEADLELTPKPKGPRKRPSKAKATASAPAPQAVVVDAPPVVEAAPEPVLNAAVEPKPKRAPRKAKADAAPAVAEKSAKPAAKPSAKKPAKVAAVAETAAVEPAPVDAPAAIESPPVGGGKKGWWQRTFG